MFDLDVLKIRVLFRVEGMFKVSFFGELVIRDWGEDLCWIISDYR